ncbi:hypothetical protein [Bacillus sp. B15-48]|uniref:hypothetical protein n=1 Tax=Bacillus sp. B15-48 TaxID=1548601 RepID=UPI0019400B28|nr:hypothetical protein [Bacillus sp. B15-48]MBM4763558.1 hypothetical protein [Bacillus sp. B15-48]
MTKPSNRKNQSSTDPTEASPHEFPGYSEEIGLEALTKKALEETKREGGAFASEKTDR